MKTKIIYTNPDHIKFVKDMKKANLKVELYHGRNFWHGPTVIVDNLQDALSNTKIPCQWDNMGHAWIVYPKSNDYSLKDVHETIEDDD